MHGLARIGKVGASCQQEASRPVLAIFLNLRVLRTLRAASSFAAASVLALALSHSTLSTAEWVQQHDDELVPRGLTEAHGGPGRLVFRSNPGALPIEALYPSIDLEPIVQLRSVV